jgi:hypothetical protein
MKLTSLLLVACALPMLAAPIDYTMTFTGGYYGSSNTLVPDAPQSGSFTYDPATGFSNFVVLWQGLSFDLTAAANITPATEFTTLTTNNDWGAVESFPIFSLPGTIIFDIGPHVGGENISATEHFPGPGIGGAIAISGNYTLTATPEPDTLRTLSLAALALLSFGGLQRRNRKS